MRQTSAALECALAKIVETEHLHAVVGTVVNVSADEEERIKCS